MRILTEINGLDSAEKFVAHLLTLDVDTQIERRDGDGDVWEIWVRDEDKLHVAKKELEAFQADPLNAKYAEALPAAQKILAARAEKREAAAKNIKRISKSNSPASFTRGRIPPLTLTLLIICLVLGVFTEFGSPRNTTGKWIMNQLAFAVPGDIIQSGGDPAASIKKGEIWRVVTPIVLHGSIIHLAMNLYFFTSLGRIIERWIGTPKFAILILTLAVLPNLLQGLSPEWMHGNPRFVGISGVVYGFLGYVWVRSTINPLHGIQIPFPIILVLLLVIMIGLSGIVQNWYLADLCHLGGLVVGSVIGFISEKA